MRRGDGEFLRRCGFRYFDVDGSPIVDVLTWGRLSERRRKDGSFRIGNDHVGGFWVSTVWLGLDHSFFEGGPPIIFETMIFDDDGALTEAFDYQERYSTLEEAKAGHARAVALVKLGVDFDPAKVKL